MPLTVAGKLPAAPETSTSKNQHVEVAKLIVDLCQACCDRFEVAHIGAKTRGICAQCLQRRHRRLYLVVRAAGNRDPGAVLRKQLGDAAVDSTGSADDHHRPVAKIDCQTHYSTGWLHFD
jgi:hypothetical protein